MGSGVFSRIELISTFSEIVGYKAGLALNEEHIREHLRGYEEFVDGDRDDVVVVDSAEFDDAVAILLHEVGHTPVRHPVMPGLALSRLFADVDGAQEKLLRFSEILNEEVSEQSGGGPIDLTPVLLRAREVLGPDGTRIALAFAEMAQLRIQQDPWSGMRRTEWVDIARLDDLFRSESLQTPYGRYIDQRFVDYLERNDSALDDMNWRKFEGLTCEFFNRAGFHVEIAEGRNDGGIDARVWPSSQSRDEPPAILVQCKRQRQKVEKVVVKALWADVVDEGAASGLIVTTSALSPGAAKVCHARSYPVHEANRATIRGWLHSMRTPFAGVFLGL